MKKILNHLIVPFWCSSFSILRLDENIKAGFFRIGQLMLKTKINNCCMIVAEIVEMPLGKDISVFADELAKNIEDRLAQYKEGLICAAEFINEVAFDAEHAHDQSECSHCPNRILYCDKYYCPAKKTPGSEEATAKHEKFMKDYDSK